MFLVTEIKGTRIETLLKLPSPCPHRFTIQTCSQVNQLFNAKYLSTRNARHIRLFAACDKLESRQVERVGLAAGD